MIRGSLAIAYLLGAIDARDIRNRMANHGPSVASDDLGRKPLVGTPSCH